MIDKLGRWFNDNHFQMTITNNGLYIKNYLKLLGIEDEHVIVKVKTKLITIKGENLSLKKILDNELLIKGSIKKVEVQDDK